MKILRTKFNFNLIESGNENENSSLRYYIDNGEEATEYFDKLEADNLLALDDEDFVAECEAYFY